MNRYVIVICVGLAAVASSCGHSKNIPSKADEYAQTAPDNRKNDKKKNSWRRDAIVSEAYKWLGAKYRYGGEERSGTDCSGMVMRVFEDAAGIRLPRNSAKQCDYCRKIRIGELQPADLVFFSSKSSRGRVTHVGVYIGRGKFIHASSSKGVITSSLDEKYYVRTFVAAGRVPGL